MSTELTGDELREGYLQRLDHALAEAPHGLANELREGIAEELNGLDANATAARINALGAPEDVARAALAEGAGAASGTAYVAAEPAQKPPLVETRGYAVGSAIALGLGGIVIPLVGWIIGAALVSTSRFWRSREKLWAVLFTPATIGVLLLLAFLTYPLSSSDVAQNPLLPTGYDLIWSAAVAGLIVAPFTGLWLLLRLRGREVKPSEVVAA